MTPTPTTQPQRLVHPLTVRSVKLATSFRGIPLATATGFVLKRSSAGAVLVTNHHVLSGRHPDTGRPLSETAAIPDGIRIAHNATELASWIPIDYRLRNDEDEPLYWEHPLNHEAVRDIAILPLSDLDPRVNVYDMEPEWFDPDLMLNPGSSVSIVGFPLGLTSAGLFPVWKTGHVASDPDLNFQGLPSFLVDATTRQGMSGSSVYVLKERGYARRDGTRVLGQNGYAFVGVYASRLTPQLEEIHIGRIWKPEVIDEILAGR